MEFSFKAVLLTLFCFGSLEFDSCDALEFIVGTENELRSILQIVKSGDTIYVANNTITVGTLSLRTFTDGTLGEPNVLKGIGKGSVIEVIEDGMTGLFIENSNWVVEDITFTGPYSPAVSIPKSSENVIVRNCTFLPTGNDFVVLQFGIESSGQNALIESCTFWVHGFVSAGVTNIVSVEPGPATIRNNTFFPKPEWEGYLGISVENSMSHWLIENNVFTHSNDETFWGFFAWFCNANVTVRNNIGDKALGGGYRICGVLAHDFEEYKFSGNHCDLQAESYCIYVEREHHYNKTYIAPDNTFENGLALTNMPLNWTKPNSNIHPKLFVLEK